MDISVSIQRAEQAVTKLNQVTQALDQAAVAASLADEVHAIGVLLEGDVKTRTPVRTGHLRDSIQSETRVATGAAIEEMISTSVVYGPPVEFGKTKGKGQFAGRRMFQRAWEETLPDILRRFEEIGITLSEELLRDL